MTPTTPFKGRQYPGELILLCVRWYLRYPLAYEHVAEMMVEPDSGRCQLHLALGPSVCVRAEQAMSSAFEVGEQELPR
jgi:hypothetical protein